MSALQKVPVPTAADGRNIDRSLGIVSGEGSTIRVDRPDEAYPTTRQVLHGTPSESGPRALEPTYYDQPAIKEPVWIWAIPVYFYTGGVAGASSLLAATAQALAPRPLRRLIRRARWVAAVGTVVSAGLLIHDLGRPARFLNMLRVFRPTSPMSVGSWNLSASGALGALAALLSRARGPLAWIGDASGYAAGVLGMPLAGYTGVLIGNTVVPIWQGGRKVLPPLFMASAISGAASLFQLMSPGARGRERAVIDRLALVGKAAELAASLVFEREVTQIDRVGRPLRDGLSGALWRGAGALSAASLVLSLAPGPRRRLRRFGEGLFGTAGALLLRAAVFHAGKASARDPRATFRQQRARLQAAACLP